LEVAKKQNLQGNKFAGNCISELRGCRLN